MNSYRRRSEDIKISMLPKWADKVITVIQWFLYTIPFVCCSIAMLSLIHI